MFPELPVKNIAQATESCPPALATNEIWVETNRRGNANECWKGVRFAGWFTGDLGQR